MGVQAVARRILPEGLPQARELEYASRKLTAIEINGTFYSTQNRRVFANGRARRRMISCSRSRDHALPPIAGARRSRRISRTIFFQWRDRIEGKLGPILWQFHPGKKFEPDDFAAFLALLPQRLDGTPIRHAVEVRHESFLSPAFIALLRKFSVAPVLVESDKHPLIADVTGDFVYARLQRTSEKEKTGYPARALDTWANAREALPTGARRMISRPSRPHRGGGQAGMCSST
jgi:uncharacterized protein YecE (DUF72 family)